MAFASPLALFALLAVPAVLVLHLFRRRYRPRRVAGVFLFAPDALVASAGRTRTRLVRSPSLWLELAAATALALWLAGPRWFAFGAAPQVVVVLDDSASMGARGHDGVTFAERARRVAAQEVQRAGTDAEVTVIATGTRPTVLLGPRAPAAALPAALAAYVPQRGWHDVEPALALARELGGAHATLLFVSDNDASVPPRGFAQRSVGEPVANLAIAHAQRLRRHGGERLLVDVTAFAAGGAQTTLTVRAQPGDVELAARSLAVEDGRVARFELELPATPATLEVCLGSDALALDDRCTLLPEPLRPVRVAVLLPVEMARDLQLGHALRALGDAIVQDGQTADLEVTTAPRDGEFAVQFVVAAGSEPVTSWLGPFLVDKRDPLLRGVSLEGVIWSAGMPPAAGRGLVFAGEHALLAEAGLEGDRLRFTLNLDASRSNLATSPDWPILLSNLVAAARARLPGATQVNLRLGEAIVWRRHGDTAGELRLVGPRGGTVLGVGSHVVTFDAAEAGEHRLLLGKEELQRFAVNFVDARESDLRACAAVDLAAAPRTESGVEPVEVRGDNERRVLALVLLMLLAIDWLVLAPRPATEASA